LGLGRALVVKLVVVVADCRQNHCVREGFAQHTCKVFQRVERDFIISRVAWWRQILRYSVRDVIALEEEEVGFTKGLLVAT